MPHAAFGLLISALSDYKSCRSALKSEHFADLVVDIALITVVEKIAVVDERNKRRRARGCLRHVINFKTFSLVRRRLNARFGIGKHLIQPACGYSDGILVVNELYKLKETVKSLTCFCRNKNNGRI